MRRINKNESDININILVNYNCILIKIIISNDDSN